MSPELLKAIGDHQEMTVGFLLAAIVIVFILSVLVYSIAQLFVRTVNIWFCGWPPPHVSADGTPLLFSDQVEDEDYDEEEDDEDDTELVATRWAINDPDHPKKFLSVKHGWCSLDQADLFDRNEKMQFAKPEGTDWVPITLSID